MASLCSLIVPPPPAAWLPTEPLRPALRRSSRRVQRCSHRSHEIRSRTTQTADGSRSRRPQSDVTEKEPAGAAVTSKTNRRVKQKPGKTAMSVVEGFQPPSTTTTTTTLGHDEAEPQSRSVDPVRGPFWRPVGCSLHCISSVVRRLSAVRYAPRHRRSGLSADSPDLLLTAPSPKLAVHYCTRASAHSESTCTAFLPFGLWTATRLGCRARAWACPSKEAMRSPYRLRRRRGPWIHLMPRSQFPDPSLPPRRMDCSHCTRAGSRRLPLPTPRSGSFGERWAMRCSSEGRCVGGWVGWH